MSNPMSWLTGKRKESPREQDRDASCTAPSSKESRSSQFLYFVGPLLFFPWWIKTPKGKWKPIHQHSWPDSEPLNGFIDSLFCSTLCVTLAQAVHTRRIKMVLVKRHYFILSLLLLTTAFKLKSEFVNSDNQNLLYFEFIQSTFLSRISFPSSLIPFYYLTITY